MKLLPSFSANLFPSSGHAVLYVVALYGCKIYFPLFPFPPFRLSADHEYITEREAQGVGGALQL